MIYVITHKDFNGEILNDNYKAVHVGSTLTEKEYLRDDTLDNISSKNKNYCELTGLYWIWKNRLKDKDEITGLVHYRRYFTTKIDDLLYVYLNRKPHILSNEKILKTLSKYDAIVPTKEKIFRTVREYYRHEHVEEDLDITRKAIEKVCPDYLQAFDKVMNDHFYYYGNMIICKSQLLVCYCKWLFPLMFEIEKNIDLNKYHNDYQKRIFGFLSERLIQVWLYKNNILVKEYPTFNTEVKRISFFKKNMLRLRKLLKKCRR